MKERKGLLFLLACLLFLLGLSCAPGNERWASVDNPAGFWAGLWHGLIIVVTFVVSLFTRDVGIYEPNNVGWGYNIGFILGCMISLGGAAGSARRRRPKGEAKWERVGEKIAAGVREGIRNGLADRGMSESEWDELGRRIEERIREKLREADGNCR